jgi:hypothetical protein
MMKRVLWAVGALLLTRPAIAQAGLAVALGPSIPVASGAEELKTGVSALVALDPKLPVWWLGLRIEGLVSEGSFKTEERARRRVFAGSMNLKIPVIGSSYVIGGFGLYNTACQGGGCAEFGGSNDAGVNGGAGVTLKVKGLAMLAEARFHALIDDRDEMSFVPISIGVIF